MGFQQVQKILNQALSAWATINGQPDLSGHGPTFSWNTKAELLAAVGHGKQLIQSEFIGNGNGAQTNLIIDLRTGLPNSGRMPLGGPYIADPDIQVIQDWIDDGCPD